MLASPLSSRKGPLALRAPLCALVLGAGLVGCSVDVDDLFGEGANASSGGAGAGGSSSSQQGGAGTGASTSTSTGGNAGTGGSGGDPSTTTTTTTTTTSTGVFCGNNQQEVGEECDGTDLNGATCADVGLTGGFVTCKPDCTLSYAQCTGSVCGNGVINPGEVCDGANLGGQSCTSQGYSDPAGAVCQNCTAVNYSGCHPTCGNSAVEPGEQCDDGNTMNGDGCSSTCQNQAIACSATAVSLTPAGATLTGTTSGMSAYGATQAQSCVNGSGDGPEAVYAVTVSQAGFLTAFLPNAGTNFDSVLHARTSCADIATQISCSDNFDNGNALAGEVISFRVEQGQTVYLFVDGFQGSAGNYELRLDLSGGDNCLDPVPITVEGASDLFLRGSTNGLFSDVSANGCNNAGFGPDVTYQVTFTKVGNYTFNTQSSGFNSVTHARSDCFNPITEVDCDSPMNDPNSTVTFAANAAETRFVFVDGTMGQSGAYTLRVQQ